MGIRQPIIAVLGHVDHGKTQLLDSIRNSSVVEKEHGRITQHIGATEVPVKEIERLAGSLLNKFKIKLEIPGLLFIDTPGHEAFTSLRERGSSIADLAILVIDVNQGIQPQTVESIKLLKSFKSPFVIALNKVDKIHGWTTQDRSFIANLKNQREDVLRFLDEKLYGLLPKLYELGFQAERIDRTQDFTKEIAIIPCSAITKEGLPEILMALTGLSQKFLKEELTVHENVSARGTILEKKEEKGLGMTIDTILFEGNLKVNDKIMFAGIDGVVKTKVKSILKPSGMQETKSGLSKFESVNHIVAAAGIKIAAPLLEKALAGTTLLAYENEEQGNALEAEIQNEIKGSMIESDDIGVIIKADTLGSLEGIIRLFEDSKISVRKAQLGVVTKNDILEAMTVKELKPYEAAVLAFNVKIEENALMESKKRGIKIIEGNVIYKLQEDYINWVKSEKEAGKNSKLNKLVYPAKIQVLKGHIFRQSKPLVVGIKIMEGKIISGMRLMKNGKVIGEIKSIQKDNKEVKKASKGEELAVSISGAEAGKDVFEGDELMSFIPNKQFEEIEKFLDLNTEEKKLLNEIKMSVTG